MKKIFVSALAFDEGKSGISNYTENSVYNLASNNSIDVAILQKDINNYTRKHSNIHFIVYPNILKHTLLNLLFHFFILPFLISTKYDFIFLPAANRRLMFFYPIYTIATFHDLSQFHIRGKYDLFRMLYIRYFIPMFLKGVDKIIAVSHNTKADMLKYLKLKDDDIVVNTNGYDKELYDMPEIDLAQQNRVSPFQKYILYISRIEHPGKNHINLIKAYELLPCEIRKEYSLVLVGSDCENAQAVHDYVNTSKYKTSIQFLGFVENSAMPTLISNAQIFVFPSLYEGFGIPLIEAMAMNVPTLCASNSSLFEIGKGVSLFFDEYDEVSIQQAMTKVIKDKNLQAQMKEAGLKRAKLYDWRSHANYIINLYEENKLLQYSKTFC